MIYHRRYDMKYTNKHDLPEIVRLWLTHDEYDHHKGVYSATTLLKPTRMVVLENIHEDELETDITDVIASRYGTALHESFEKVEMPGVIQEKRLFAEFEGNKLSGKPDMMRGVDNLKHAHVFKMVDIKSTSVWTYIYGSRDEDHRIQLSIYRWLAKQNGYRMIHEGEIIYLFTDWSKSRAKQGGEYPPIRVMVKDVELMSTEEVELFIRVRLGEIHHYLDNPSQLPPCTREELWQGDDKWAVMKQNRKSAVKVWDIEDDASNHVVELGEGIHWIEHRPAKANRCNYCLVTRWCEQFKELENAGLLAE